MFEADPKVAEIAQAYAADMVDFAKAQYQLDLDYTIESIDRVEQVATDLVAKKPRFARFTPGFAAKMDSFSKGIGFYVAETIKRMWTDAEHGWVQILEGDRIYGLKLDNGTLCWPVGRAKHRLEDGNEYDLRPYVAALRPGEPPRPPFFDVTFTDAD